MPDLNIFRPITTFILDVDGVMTDNRILVTENGECLRNMNIRDGYAIRRAIWKDYRFFVITAGKSDGVV
ncbi:MAG TPA: 3-deoxy-D-manno-octulosonate 8-phosphate phosphatase, partial [Saprospiraceae bacterium]|nr:3-deoxy-D-manno-octulosonate 8-phosphate phosphatase [Saprospiraceae bacterium]